MVLTKAILDVVISLAKQRSESHDVYYFKFFPDGLYCLGDDEHEESYEYQCYQQYEKVLNCYLSEFDYELIKDLQALMYLGRDKDFYDEPEGLKRFDLTRKDLFWNNDKNIEVQQMVEKLPLDKYLVAGKEIIGW